jgi:hypothetical protein
LFAACGDDASQDDSSAYAGANAGDSQTSNPVAAADGGTSGTSATPGTSDTPAEAAAPAATGRFPLRISPDGHHMLDHAGRPFLINQASSWGLIQSLSTEDARTYLDQLAKRNWNAVMVSIISNDARMPGDPPAWRGIEPFRERWDFSTPNDAYFDHADEVLKMARERGMLVTLVPSYLGYPEDATQGWADELQSSSNSVDKSRAYGRYLGRRYKSFDNIIWVAGGDNRPEAGSELEAHMLAIVEGIRAEDPDHLWTAHWSGKDTGMLASENEAFAPYIDIDGYYAFNYELTYEKVLNQYGLGTGRPLFHLDMSYETEWGGEPAEIRQRAYDAILSGATGSSFNAGPDWYLFRNFRNVSTPGARETQYWYRLFSAKRWYELTPDTDHSAVTAGYGERGSTDYVCAAHSPDYSLVMAYLGHGGSVTVDLGKVPGERARVVWYDPTSGETRGEREYATTGQQPLAAPSNQSWVLVVESK